MARTLVMSRPPRNLSKEELKNIFIEAAGGVEIVGCYLDRSFFMNYNHPLHAERAYQALKDNYDLRFSRNKTDVDTLQFVLEDSAHPDMDKDHLRRLIQEYSVSDFRMFPRGGGGNSPFEWILEFDDLRDVPHVERRMQGMRYDGGIIRLYRVIEREREEEDRPLRPFRPDRGGRDASPREAFSSSHRSREASSSHQPPGRAAGGKDKSPRKAFSSPHRPPGRAVGEKDEKQRPLKKSKH